MQQVLSPKQVAEAIGVSESSLKRWCDQGLIATEKTVGGHRRIRIGEVVRFLRSQNLVPLRPELIGLPTGIGGVDQQASEVAGLLHALRHGDQEQSRRYVLGRYLSGESIVQVCERLVVPVLHEIGDQWACGKLEVFEEHQACEIFCRIIHELRSLAPRRPETAPLAIGGSPEDDPARLPSLMIELTLAEAGWHAVAMGCSLPYSSLALAVRRYRPSLVWLSVTHTLEPQTSRVSFRRFAAELPPGVRVVVGGRACDASYTEGLPHAFYRTDFSSLAQLGADLIRTAPEVNQPAPEPGDSASSPIELEKIANAPA